MSWKAIERPLDRARQCSSTQKFRTQIHVQAAAAAAATTPIRRFVDRCYCYCYMGHMKQKDKLNLANRNKNSTSFALKSTNATFGECVYKQHT